MNKKTLAVLKSVFLPLLPLMIMSALAARAQSPFFQAVTNLNPVAYWPLQENVQPPVADVETNLGSLGAVANAYYSSTNTVKGVAGINSGDNDPSVNFLSSVNGGFLAVPLTDSRVALQPGPFSVELWVYPTNSVASTIIAQTGIAGTGGLNNGANSAGWSVNLGYVPSQGSLAMPATVSFHVYNGVGITGGAEGIFTQPNFTINQWYHVVAVYDGTNAYIYVNGTQGSPQYAMTGTQARDTWDPLTIGCGRGLNNNRFGGSLDEIAIYTNVLTFTQVNNHYSSGTQGLNNYQSTILADKPYMYWRMNAPAYTTPAATAYPTALNYGTGNSINGLYLSGTTPGVAGPALAGMAPSFACAFNGIGTSSTNIIPIYTNGVLYATNTVAETGVIVTNYLSSMSLFTNNMSIMYWFKANPQDSRRGMVLGHSDNSWRSSFTNGFVSANTAKTNGDFATTPTYNDGNWHFAVITYTNSLAHVNTTGWLATNYIYVDGNLIFSGVQTNGAGSTTFTNIAIGVAPDHIRTGNGNVYDNQVFAGSLAHVAFFTNTLTAQQVTNLYVTAGGALLPVITGQPVTGRTNGANGNNGTGSNSISFFGVNFIGAGTVQWYFNSASNYSGATLLANGNKYAAANASVTGLTAQTMTVSNLVDSDSGFYYAVLGNGFGSVTTILASIKVIVEPVLSQTPAGGTLQLYQGQNYTLSVAASVGETNYFYQWYTNGVADTTAGTATTYALNNVQPAMSGTTYQCIVTNIAGSATNSLVTLSVLSLPPALTNSLYGSNVLAMAPSAYWPLHEISPGVNGATETNIGVLGKLANAYYADWTGSIANTGIVRQVAGALINDPDPAVGFDDLPNNTALGYPGIAVIPRTSPATTLAPPFTIECWAKPYQSGFGDMVSENGSLNSANNQNDGVRLCWGSNTGGAATQGFQVFVGNGSTRTGLPGASTTMPIGQWYHVAVTYDGAQWILYVNGNAVITQATNSTFLMAVDTGSPICIASGLWGNNGPGRCFPGAIDEVAIYTNVLQQSDISTHYNDGTSGTAGQYKSDVLSLNPIIYLRMDAPAYTPPPLNTWPVATNYGTAGGNGVYSPGSMPGAVTGPPALGVSGNKVMPGNNMSAFVDVGNNAALNPTGSTPFSYGAWFKGNPADSRLTNSIIGHSGGSVRTFLTAAGKLQAHAGLSDVVSAASYNDGNWHQFMVTYTGTNVTTGNIGTNVLYVDGAAVGQTSGGPNTGTPSLDMMIGDDPGATNLPYGLGQAFGGQICEASFWNGVTLSSNQVSTLYNASGQIPIITGQPISSSINATTSFTNLVTVFGSNPLFYQWYRDGQPLPVVGQTDLPIGGTNATLIISPAQTNDTSANYYVVITNQFGAATSSIASLTVFGLPIFTNEPVLATYTNNIILFSNVTPTFRVGAVGAQPLNYQWYTNGVPAGPNSVSAVTNTLPPIQLGGGGVTNFFCVASNFLGTATNTPISIVGIPAPTAPYPVTILGSSPIGYWRLDEPNVDGFNNGNFAYDYWGGQSGIYTNTVLGLPGYTSSFTPNTDPSETAAQFGSDGFAQDNDAYGIGGFDFSTPNGTSSSFSIEAWVNGNGNSQHSDSGMVSKGYSGAEQFSLDNGSDSLATHGLRFLVRDASGTTHLANSAITMNGSSAWYHLVGVCDEVNGAVTLYVNGAVAGSATITTGSGILGTVRKTIIGSRPSNATTNNNDLFFQGLVNDVSVYNYALSSGQVAAHYAAAGVPPYFTQVPAAVIVTNGFATLTIPAGVVGTGPMNYGWTDNNSNIVFAVGSTNGSILNASLTTLSVPLNWNGDTLTLGVTNIYGSTNITIALTILTNAPILTVDLPAQVSEVSGKTFTYTPSVVGPQPYSFQWFTNGSVLGSATGATLPIVAGVPGTTTNFYVIVTNIFGAATSSVSKFVSVATNTYEGFVAGFNPVGYWPLQETTAPAPATIETNYGTLGAPGNAYYSFTNDSSGGQHGQVQFQQGGMTSDGDYAVGFNGAAVSYAFVPRSTPALTVKPPFSAECWINSSSSGFSDLLGESGGGLNSPGNGGNFGGFRLSYGGNNGTPSGTAPNIQFYVANGNGSTRNDVASPDNSIPFNVPHHVVATYDGTNVTIYIDGIGTVTNGTALAGTTAENPDTWTPFSLGGSFWQTNNGVILPIRSYSGVLDEVAIYTNILNPTQVSAHYAAASSGNYPLTISNDHPLLYYRMNCATYTNPPASLYPLAVNYGSAPEPGFYPSGITPAGVSGPPILTQGTNMVAAPGNGNFSCVDANTDPTYNVTGTNKFSAMIWVRTYPADPRVQTIMSHGITNWAMNLDGTTGRVIWNTFSGGNVTSTGVLNDGLWHFLVGVEDGRTNYLYVDGALNSQAALSTTNGLTGEPAAHIYLGGNQDVAAVNINQRYLNGAVAEAALFTNALTSTQVLQLFQAAVSTGAPFITTNVVAPFLAMPGYSVSNSVSVIGQAPLAYQWSYNGANLTDGGRLAGSKTNVLSISSVTNSDAGNYQVVITNAFGSATSSVATLIVGSLPVKFNTSGPGWQANQSGTYSEPAVTNGLLTLSDANGSQARSFFFRYPQYIGAFVASFTYQAAGNLAADGITFCVQNDVRGAAALGGPGGSLGVSGITPSAEVEFDIFATPTGSTFHTNGATGGYLGTGSLNLKSGDPIGVNILYANGQMSLSFTDAVASTSFSTNYLIGDLTQIVSNTVAYVGLTGADGGSTSIQTITNFTFISIPPVGIVPNSATAGQIIWPAVVTGYQIQQNTDLSSTNWGYLTNAPFVFNGANRVNVQLNSSNAFYRLILTNQ